MEYQQGQREALERAKAAAADPNCMLDALAQSYILDGLVERLDRKWEHLDREDCCRSPARGAAFVPAAGAGG